MAKSNKCGMKIKVPETQKTIIVPENQNNLIQSIANKKQE
jgi:hypothetical protein